MIKGSGGVLLVVDPVQSLHSIDSVWFFRKCLFCSFFMRIQSVLNSQLLDSLHSLDLEGLKVKQLMYTVYNSLQYNLQNKDHTNTAQGHKVSWPQKLRS